LFVRLKGFTTEARTGKNPATALNDGFYQFFSKENE